MRDLLEAGHEVTAVVRSPGKLGPFAEHRRLSIALTDLEDGARVADALPGHDACVHAALLWGEPRAELDVRDVAVAARLFDAAGTVGVKRCIYISSAAVHRPFSSEMCEESCLGASDLYGATKAAGELFLRAACAVHPMTGVVVRPGPVVGPPAFAGGSFRSPARLAEMVAAAAAGRPIEARRDDGRQFSDVSTVANVVRLLTTAPSPHPAYLCVDRDIITWERVAQRVVECLSSTSEVRVVTQDAERAIPRFRTERLERLTGGPAHAERALVAHIRHLARTLVASGAGLPAPA